MTHQQMIDPLEFAKAVDQIRFPPGSFDKRFSNNIASSIRFGVELTEKQTVWMYRIIYKYRRQCPALYQKCKDHPDCIKQKGGRL